MRSVLWFALGLPLIACGGGAARAPGADVAPVVNPGAQPRLVTGTPGCPELPTEPVIPQKIDGGTVLTLLDAGSEPRRTLRYRPELGARWTTTIEMDTSATGEAFQLVLPTMRMTMVADVIDVDEASMQQRVVIEEATAIWRDGVAEGVVEPMNDVFELYVCTSSDVRSDLRGTPLEGHNVGLTPELAASMEQLSGFNYILPHEPIGVGASWEVKMHRIMNGAPVTMTMVLDAVEIGDDTLHLRGTIGGGIDAPMTTDDGNTFGSMTMLGALDVTLDLRTTRAAGTVTLQTLAEVTSGASPTTITSDLAVRMSSR